jgi:hypothetical protein
MIVDQVAMLMTMASASAIPVLDGAEVKKHDE